MQRTATSFVMCLPLLVGCAGEIISGSPEQKGTGGSGPFTPGASGGSAAVHPGSGGGPATGGAGVPTGPSSGSGGTLGRGSGGAPGSEPGTTSGALPCDVDAVLRGKCQSCHGTVPLNGAPVPLVTYADTQAHAVSSPTMSVWQVMQTRVHSTTMSVMPPRGQPALSAAELASLDAWFAAGTPAGTKACGSSGASGSTGAGGSNGAGGAPGISTPGVGPDALPCKPTHYFRAHAEGSSTAKYPVPNPSQDSYTCFNFKSPFAPGEQATAWAPITDDARVIHHWILYGTTSPVTDGSITQGCEATTLLATHVAGWAPGGQNAVFDPDVGLTLDYPYYQLQVHYNNLRYSDAADASGVAFCSTTTPRQNAAGIVVLGNMLFSIPANANDYAVNNTCSNLSADGKTPITVVSTSPHMHLLGTGFRTQHMRGLMDMGDLSNIPLGTWSFDGQRAYEVNRRQIMPGDSLRTTCYYDNPNPKAVNFGPKTSDEMCFNFITVYPYTAATKTCMSLF